MRIDAYAHAVPKSYYEEMGEVYQAPAYKRHPKTAGFWDYDRRIDHLDSFGIDRQIVALGGPHLWPGIRRYTDSETIHGLVRKANDEIRAVADQHPDRFIPVGTLPVLDEFTVDEAERCVDDLDMVGLQIYSNYDGVPLDSKALFPVYEFAENRSIPLWIHPQIHDWYNWTYQWGMDLSLGWLFDTSLALARLVLSGLLERYPNLDFITHHGGGLIPHFMERLQLFYYDEGTFGETPEVFDGGHEPLTEPIEEYFTRFYADTVMYGSVSSLQTVYDVYGPDQMLFATDYPYGGHAGQDFMGGNLKALEDIDIPESEKAKIYSDNIEMLIGQSG